MSLRKEPHFQKCLPTWAEPLAHEHRGRDTQSMQVRLTIKAEASGRTRSGLDSATSTPCVQIRGFSGWEEWLFEVDISVTHWPAVAEEWDDKSKKMRKRVRQIPPPKKMRRNARHPFDDQAVYDAVVSAATAVCGGGHGGDVFIDLFAAASPSPHRQHGKQRRAATIASLYELAHNRGFSPRKTITALYGLDVDADRNERPNGGKKLQRWIRIARTEKRPDGRPYLGEYAEPPRQWPISRRHPNEPKNLRHKSEPKTGPYSGRELVVHARRTKLDCDGPVDVIGPDVELTGIWDDGTELPLETIRQVDPTELLFRLIPLTKELEERYPGARVKATTG